MLATMRVFFILALFCLVGWSNCQSCPEKYKRFSTHHSFCLPPNRTCHVLRTGVSQQDKQLILKFHNQFRSKVAMGNEHRSLGGSLPQAADMMQMVWDDELASIAQKWTENCHWGHDCDGCKEVESFPVGQNLAIQYSNGEPDWTWAMNALYDEVMDYYRNWLSSFQKHPGPKTGHFTQIIWSKSWRVGCGYSLFNDGFINQRYYACNYGPGGNVESQPVYKPGQPCSSCPTNTQCSTYSSGANSFPGLCKMNDPNTAPAYPINTKGLIFYCGASSSDPDCQNVVSGDGSFRAVNSVGGNYYSMVVQGGQSVTLTFNKQIQPHGDRFCLYLYLRKGPLDPTRSDQSTLLPGYKFERGYTNPKPLQLKPNTFTDFYNNLSWGMKTKYSLTFSVPRGAGKHILDIRKIMAFDGDCSSRRN